jgi:hypothetical protein
MKKKRVKKKDSQKAAGEKGMNSLCYAEFVVPLVKAVQEIAEENRLLKERIEKLENKNKTNIKNKLI